ncbi:MAG: phytoene/squalene synthase family protein [Candidatus Kapabacteria bacterium]|nr:phytoene/squalene synthase family protein [Candidatus Kapabacteria bacterium]
MIDLFNTTAFACSKKVTVLYSNSFSMGIKALDKRLHDAIYGIYGFVRFADEIVDTFHNHNKHELLQEFKRDTYKAIEQRISLNPVLHAFQLVVHQYNIRPDYIEAFFRSMEMDLYNVAYEPENYNEYIYGSAEVVGLMCLQVFCEGDEQLFTKLLEPARALGAAFQKVNFLRDIKSDFEERGRVYFPGINFHAFDAQSKKLIEQDIENDFKAAYAGIVQLPNTSRFGVYLAYTYYLKLFYKIRNTPAERVANARIRISNARKVWLLAKAYWNKTLFGFYAQ